MNKFLAKLISFILIISVAYSVMFVFIVFSKKLKAPCELQPNIENLIVGDSHTMWGINDNKISNTQNIALNGECYLYTYAKLRYVLNQKNDIKKIYLGISMHNLSEYFDDYIYGEMAFDFFYRYVDVLNFQEYEALFQENPKTFLQMSGVVIKTWLKGVVKTGCDFIGSFPNERMIQSTSQEQIKKRILHQYYNDGLLNSYSSLNLRYLDKIIKLCKDYNIPVIALNTPMQKDYKELIPSEFVNKYNELLKEYKLNVVDFKDFELPDSCFLPDGDHLNYYGAMATSKELNKIINEQLN